MADKGLWTKFFRDVGFNQDVASKYSSIFVENRMTLQHLRHLNRDLLKEMGITAVGDIISITQHIGSIDIEKLAEAHASSIVSSTTPNLEKTVIPPGHEVPVPIKRRVTKEIEGSYIVKLPEGKTEKTRQILQKLGKGDPQANSEANTIRKVEMPAGDDYEEDSDDDNFEVTISSTSPTRSSVFDRLGAPVISLTPPTAAGSTSVLARFVNRTIAANSLELSGPQNSPKNLKRSASDSIFNRLGAFPNNSNKARRLENPDSLPYQGVLKLNGSSRSSTNPTAPRNSTGCLQSSNASSSSSTFSPPTRIPAKERLGFITPKNRPTTEGILGSTSRGNVHSRLGKRPF